MKQIETVLLLVTLIATVWWLIRSRFSIVRARAARAVRVAAVLYVALMAWRLATVPVSWDQIETAAVSLGLFGLAWGLLWLLVKRTGNREQGTEGRK